MSGFNKRVQELNALAARTQGNAAIAVLTLENVGHVSGTRGLAASGAALAEYHRRLSELLRPSDQMLVLSDDRVCLVFDELLDDNHVLLAALKVERAFEEPFVHEGQSVKLEVRAGHVYFGKQEQLRGLTAEDLYRFAESAREHAARSKVGFEISTEEVFTKMQRDWEVNEAMQTALEQHELTLDYQPKYRLADGELVGAVLCGHDGRRGYIHHLAVRPESRRQGIGRQLVRACLSGLHRQGMQKCHLFVFRQNSPAIAFWLANNFTGRDELSMMSTYIEQPF